MSHFDVIIIGAGPAGMAAAVQAAGLDLRVAVIDEQPAVGGQIYRGIETVPPHHHKILGEDYGAGADLARAFRASGATHIPGAVVWSVDQGYTVTYSQDQIAKQVTAPKLIIATGALERPMPMPGWTLPGVMTVGAAQILLKSSSVIAKDAVLVGSGPLIYLVAAQMIRANTPPAAIVETHSLGDLIRAAPKLPRAAFAWKTLVKGLGLLREIRAAQIPRYRGARDINILGSDHATGVRFKSGSQDIEIKCNTILLHHGVVPNTQIARSLRLGHVWSDQQHCFHADVDDWGQFGDTGCYCVGDGAAISGAISAAITGRLAALDIAHKLGAISAQTCADHARPLWRDLRRDRSIRPFLDAAYPPYAPALHPSDDTVVCRCEEITAKDIRTSATLGAMGPNQAKAFVRVGMGPCQGRYCGLTVTQILADAHGQSPDETGYFRIRAPLKPVTLGEVAHLHSDTDG